MNKAVLYSSLAALMLATGSASANLIKNGALDMWADEGWTQFADDDGYRESDGKVNPGWGGQRFDAEFFYYKLDGDTLSIGLQTGFDIEDNVVTSGSRDYYGGDVQLILNGEEFAIDFGLYTKSYHGAYSGTDEAGVYGNVKWNNDIYFDVSSPFAMESGDWAASLLSNDVGSAMVGGELSFYRTVSVDLNDLLGSDDLYSLSAHWTMSCGNDAIDGAVKVPPTSVPEPSAMALMGIGLIGLLGGGIARRRRS